jgi:predicted amidophosphoribosyltransferase
VIGAALLALERLLLPNSCVSCGRVVVPSEPDALVCAQCYARLRAVPAGCARCCQPLPPVGPCRFCADWPEAFEWVRSAVWLGDEARDIVHHLKYQAYTLLADVIADKMQRLAKPAGRLILVPVPLSQKRLRKRGYNQAEAIARALAARWKCDVDSDVLVRIRDTKSQTKLTPDERGANVGGAFCAAPPPTSPRLGGEGGEEGEERLDQGISPSPPSPPSPSSPSTSVTEPPKPTSIILVDDVLTTGATLVAAASALQDAGWSSVGAVTFARALPFVVRVETT